MSPDLLVNGTGGLLAEPPLVGIAEAFQELGLLAIPEAEGTQTFRQADSGPLPCLEEAGGAPSRRGRRGRSANSDPRRSN